MKFHFLPTISIFDQIFFVPNSRRKFRLFVGHFKLYGFLTVFILVLLCPGTYFAVSEDVPNPYCRAAFSLASEEDMNEAFRRLADLIRANQ